MMSIARVPMLERFAQTLCGYVAPKPLAIGERQRFRLVSIDAPDFAIVQSMGYLNSKPWRGNQRHTVRLSDLCWDRLPDGRYDSKTTIEAGNGSQLVAAGLDPARIYGETDFNRLDFGDPLIES